MNAQKGNVPTWYGEWALPVTFTPTDAFLMDFADAQKSMYSQSKGWIVSALPPLLLRRRPCVYAVLELHDGELDDDAGGRFL